ncbi:MAG: hypothetical protein IKT01_03100 [Eubacteriaceae bacterium]|nr:hypothetical protein [Eubacteriaceae bacterium]
MRRIRRVLPHLCMILAIVLLTLLIIDVIFNPAMGFVDNLGAKLMMMALCVLTIVNTLVTVIGNYQRAVKNAALRAQQRAAARQSSVVRTNDKQTRSKHTSAESGRPKPAEKQATAPEFIDTKPEMKNRELKTSAAEELIETRPAQIAGSKEKDGPDIQEQSKQSGTTYKIERKPR